MSGYKRVNFYELCRLCATNQQKEKTHIFREEGRKIQLQNKIQSCLSLKVCENDFLPKVVCSQCLRTLEENSTFRKECYTSETMLSSYFNNFRYTEDFKKSGKVYIKDTSPKVAEVPIQNSANQMTTTPGNAGYNVGVVSNINGNISHHGQTNQQHQESMPYYTLHLPSSVLPQETAKAVQQKDQKMLTQPHQIVYNLNTIKTVVPSAPKTSLGDPIGNVTVNANGEIITIAPLMDMDALFAQNIIQKPQSTPRKIHRKHKESKDDPNVIKIDLTQPDVDPKRDMKLQQKISYTIKLDDAAKAPFVLNQIDTTPLPNRTEGGGAFSTPQPLILNSTPRVNLPTVNRIKTYQQQNFNIPATNLISSIAAGLTPGAEVVAGLNPEPPPGLPSISGFNQIQQYSTSNGKDVQVDAESVALSGLFNSTGGGVQLMKGSLPQAGLGYPNLSAAPACLQTFGNIPGTPPSPTMTKLEGEAVAKRHSCDICCKTFKRREHLYQHVKLHTGFRPFKCENCNKSFMRKEHLLRHMTSHSGQKNFMCNVCEKSFSRNDNLLKHKKIHAKQNSFTCEVCQKQFVMEHYYLAHKHTHDGDKCNVNPVWGLLKAV